MTLPNQSSQPKEQPAWAREAVQSTEELMSEFYSTGSQPSSLSAAKRPETAAPLNKADTISSTRDQTAVTSAGESAPLNLAIEEDAQGREVAAPARSSTDSAPSSSLSTRSEPGLRTRTPSTARRRGPAIQARGWASSGASAGADPALAEILPGKSSDLYRAFYERTHGAANPTMEIKATKLQLSAWSGIANKNTLIRHIQHLLAVRLLRRNLVMGDTEGAVYKVRLLEEAGVPLDSAEAFYRQISGDNHVADESRVGSGRTLAAVGT